MADAVFVFRSKTAMYGGTVEMVVWQVPTPVPPSGHAFKYRLVFVRDGQRVVGYDNERGKGDHRHIKKRELKYRFVDIETLVHDFLADVEATR